MNPRLNELPSRQSRPPIRGIALTAACTLGLILGWIYLDPGLFDAIFVPERSGPIEPGPFPSDWFMAQRVWPDQIPDYTAYRHALDAADRIPRAPLDEHPPWVPAGPTNIGGRIADLLGHPSNEDVMYVAAASGGIFKTTDGGSSWMPVFDDAPGMSMGALAMDPNDPNVIYAGTGEASSAGFSYFGTGVYRTRNGGATWTHLGLDNSRYIARIVVDPEDSDRIWVAAMGELFGVSPDRGIYLSEDGGLTWERSLFVNDTTGASDVVLDPDHPQTVYAAMWQRYRNPESRRAGGRGSGVYKSIDGGDQWVRLTDGLPPQADDVGRIGLAVSPSNPQVLYAIYADHPGYFAGVYRTSDGGETWGRVNDGPLDDIYSSFGWYFGNIRVRPDDPDVVFALGVELYRSLNGGTTWRQIDDNVHVDHHAMWFDPQNSFRILLGNDGGLYESINSGNSWDFIGGLPINQFYAANVDPQNPERLYGGTQDNGTMRTQTGGMDDYDRILGGDGFYVTVDPQSSNLIYAEYQYGNLLRSPDGGFGWEWILDGIDDGERTNWSTPVVMDPNDRRTLYYGAERLYRTINQGGWWDPISPDLTDGGGSGNLGFGTITTIGVSPVDSDVIYVGTDDANVWSTVNGGETWTDRSAGLPERWITRVVAHPTEAATAYVTVSGFRNAENDAHLFRSTAFGENWTSISGNLPPGPLNDVVVDPEYPGQLYVASDFGAYVSVNEGETWVELGVDLPRVPVLDLVLHNESRKLVAASYGRSFFTLNLNELFVNRPPQISGANPSVLDTVLVPQEIEFSVSAEDPDEDSLTYLWTRNGAEIGVDSSVTLHFTEAGAETLTVVVSDGELTDSHHWSFVTALPDPVEPGPAIPENHLLARVYPNPFNGSATIRYRVGSSTNLSIEAHDVTGRRVQSISHSRVPAGTGLIRWNADHLPSGTYFVTVRSQTNRSILKTLLIK